MSQLEQLNDEFGIPGVLKFVAGNGGLPKAVLTTSRASAEVYLHGAHVTHFQPTGQPPLLFISGKSRFEAGKSIRGGVPICFPWFGNLEDQPEAPAHGFARTSEWIVVGASKLAYGASVVLRLASNGDAASAWPHAFNATYTVTIDLDSLSLSLEVKNTAKAACIFEEALHSYFNVSDVRQVSVTGLAGSKFLDKLRSGQEFTEGREPIQINGETDRIYMDTTLTCTITDPGFNREISVMKDGSDSTVLWNPWIAKAKSMTDFGDDEWPAMLCIETCNVGRSAVNLEPGESHIMQARIEASSTERS